MRLTTGGIVPLICESNQKIVTSLMIHTIVAVPGLPDVLRIFPEDGKILPLIACTWIPLIFSVSSLLLRPSVEKVVTRVLVPTTRDAAVILLPAI